MFRGNELSTSPRNWIKPVLSLTVLVLLVSILPSAPMDPWNLLSPKKVATLIFALTFIQVVGGVLSKVLGTRGGAILTGFLGGLISSTATTAALAKRSRKCVPQEGSAEDLTFLAATAAMLFEGIALLFTGTSEFHFALSFIFIAPLLVTVLLIYLRSRKIAERNLHLEASPFRVLPVLKLAAFIVVILILSKILQRVFGQGGLLVLTFLVSLFEIHGSIIANLQLHDSGGVSVELLGGLLAVSILASYLSKLFLIFALGSRSLKSHAARSTFFLLISLLASWLTLRICRIS